ncbi:MAG: hypothetical protein HOK69_11770, partial [Gammaproteobacteria bacterium]|nr:hypothetical protein [Gammaproteobacteria bacterium]
NLVNFIKRMRHKPKEVRLVHGDKGAKEQLKQELSQLLPESKVWVP